MTYGTVNTVRICQAIGVSSISHSRQVRDTQLAACLTERPRQCVKVCARKTVNERIAYAYVRNDLFMQRGIHDGDDRN